MPRGDQIELADVSSFSRDTSTRLGSSDRDIRQEANRAQKRRWLDEQDEMKFSHSIQFNAVPDWSSHYIAYSNLKKLIYQLERNVHQQSGGDAESQPLIRNADPTIVFSRALDVELEKICSFYSVKEKELIDDVQRVVRDVGTFESGEGSSTAGDVVEGGQVDRGDADTLVATTQQSRGGSPVSPASSDDGADDSDQDGDETAALNRPSRRRRSTEAVTYRKSHLTQGLTDPTSSSVVTRSRRYSTTYEDYSERDLVFSSNIMLKKRIIGLYVQLCELKSYVQLNRTGFSKVLKKFDKIVNRQLRSQYMDASVETAVVFRAECRQALEENIALMEKAYTSIVSGGDEAAAKRDLRSHLREHVVWERNTVWRDLIGMERRAEAASLGHTLLGRDPEPNKTRRQGDDERLPLAKVIATPIGRFRCPAWLVNSTMLTLVILTALFLAMISIPFMKAPEQQSCLAVVVFVSLLWATEAIPLFVTSLLIPFLVVLLRVVRGEKDGHTARLGSKDAADFVFSAMWNPVIMLLLGGFTLAAALSKRGIDKRIATFVLSKAGTSPRTVVLSNMFVAAFASMLISNVAAPVLCFGIIEPMLRNLPSGSDMSKAVIMAIALASNIGGMLSPIASPQNIIALEIMSPDPTWGTWFFIVIPVGVISILLIWLLLLLTFRPGQGTTIVPVRPVRDSFAGVDWFVTIVTLCTIVLWCFSHDLEPVFGHMGVIAIIPMVLFFGVGILTKEDFNNFPWTIIILAAGGIALGKSVDSSGLLATVAQYISRAVADMSLYGVMVVFCVLMLVIATFISHTVAAVILLPILADVGKNMNMDDPRPNLLVMAGVLMCSAAMGLPTSGFPNMTAIMKEDPTGQRYLQVKHFISRGVPSSVITFFVVITVGYLAMRVAGI